MINRYCVTKARARRCSSLGAGMGSREAPIDGLAADDARIEHKLAEDDELFLMSNLFPKTTGLAWIELNEVALMDHWNGLIDAFELAQRLRRL